MEIQKILTDWNESLEMKDCFDIVKNIKDTNAIDIDDITKLSIKASSLNAFEVVFIKNNESYLLKCTNATNILIETEIDDADNNCICIRNGMKNLNLVISYNKTIYSCNFISGSLNKIK